MSTRRILTAKDTGCWLKASNGDPLPRHLLLNFCHGMSSDLVLSGLSITRAVLGCPNRPKANNSLATALATAERFHAGDSSRNAFNVDGLRGVSRSFSNHLLAFCRASDPTPAFSTKRLWTIHSMLSSTMVPQTSLHAALQGLNCRLRFQLSTVFISMAKVLCRTTLLDDGPCMASLAFSLGTQVAIGCSAARCLGFRMIAVASLQLECRRERQRVSIGCARYHDIGS